MGKTTKVPVPWNGARVQPLEVVPMPGSRARAFYSIHSFITITSVSYSFLAYAVLPEKLHIINIHAVVIYSNLQNFFKA